MKVIIIALMGLCATTAYQADDSVRRANSEFADDLADKLMGKDGNMVFSPFSAHAALSMLYQGAGGTTKEALATALYLPEPTETAQAYDIVLNDLNSDDEQIDLKVANKVYVDDGSTLKLQVSHALENYFHSDVQPVNFAQNVAAANLINTWVEHNTDNKVHDLLQPNDLSVDTRIVLVNAFYFKGGWLYPFDKQLTRPANFYVDVKTTVQVPMMSTSGDFLYVKDDKYGAEIVGLPFKNTNYTFLIILPVENYGADGLSKFSIKDAIDLVQGHTEAEIDLYLPKFKLSRTTDMKELLKKIGLSELFDTGRCDLTNMFTNNQDIYVSKAVQKTYIDVNEFGCEAAAASGVVGTGRSLHLKVAVNRPFLFTIVHKIGYKYTDMLLMGRVVNPVDNLV